MSNTISTRIPDGTLHKLKQVIDNLQLTNTEFINMMVDIFISSYNKKYDVNKCLPPVNNKNNNTPYQDITNDIDELLDSLKQN